VSSGVLYSIQVRVALNISDKTLLIISGDEGVLVFDWEKQIAPYLDNVGSVSETIKLVPISRFRPYPSACESNVEVNDVQVRGSHLFGAAGDAFGCYKWDLSTETVVTTYQSPLRQYLLLVTRTLCS
jgi:hypothetical protein